MTLLILHWPLKKIASTSLSQQLKVAAISGWFFPFWRRHWFTFLAASLWRIPAPVCACLERSDKIPALLRTVGWRRYSRMWVCHWARTGEQQKPNGWDLKIFCHPFRDSSQTAGIRANHALDVWLMGNTDNFYMQIIIVFHCILVYLFYFQ